ncbi:kinase-like domain-containing protein [Aspergillus unguis]
MDLSLYCQNNLLYTQEALSKYRPGGYHPVTLGDTFENGRYQIHHKLGWGGFSTVWLAKDRDRNEWVSLKIMTANSSISRELQNLRFLERKAQTGLSSHYIVQLLDVFHHKGPNGVHQCLVFELLGPSVDKVLWDYNLGQDKLDPETVLRMSTQLLKAVEFIHSAGIGHGDISGRNIAFTCTHLAKQSEEQLFEVLGCPEIEPLKRIDGTPLEKGLPTQLVKAAEWTEWIEEDDEDLRLLDFGESFYHGQEPEKLAQPGSLKVLETIFTDCFNHRVDLWRTGCMIYSFLFTTWPFWYLGEDEMLALQMIGFVERLPAEWEAKWESMVKESRRNLEIEDYGTSKLERKFADLEPDPTLQPLLGVMQGLMRFLPSSRLTAEEALGLLGNPGDE